MFSSTLLAGKVALVTGSTAGIGGQIAEQLAEAGAETVIINGRTVDSGEARRAELEAQIPGTRFLFAAGDSSKPEDMASIFDVIEKEAGGLDIYVHTGMSGHSGGGPRPFVETDREYWTRSINGILLSLIEGCSRAVPMMLARGGGAIVSIASDAAKVATPGEAVLGGALAGNVMFCRTLGLELGRQQIRVNAVTPSITKGTRTYDRVMAGGFSRALFQKAERKARLGVASASDVAHAAVFLASPLASHITGQALSVNGGISAA